MFFCVAGEERRIIRHVNEYAVFFHNGEIILIGLTFHMGYSRDTSNTPTIEQTVCIQLSVLANGPVHSICFINASGGRDVITTTFKVGHVEDSEIGELTF